MRKQRELDHQASLFRTAELAEVIAFIAHLSKNDYQKAVIES